MQNTINETLDNALLDVGRLESYNYLIYNLTDNLKVSEAREFYSLSYATQKILNDLKEALNKAYKDIYELKQDKEIV